MSCPLLVRWFGAASFVVHLRRVDEGKTGDVRSRAQGTTPARVRQIHREQLAAPERERGDKFWVLNAG